MPGWRRKWRPEMDNRTLNYLALARKAGLAELGEEPVGAAARAGKAHLILVAGELRCRHRPAGAASAGEQGGGRLRGGQDQPGHCRPHRPQPGPGPGGHPGTAGPPGAGGPGSQGGEGPEAPPGGQGPSAEPAQRKEEVSKTDRTPAGVPMQNAKCTASDRTVCILHSALPAGYTFWRCVSR